jgi:hypothetical protein
VDRQDTVLAYKKDCKTTLMATVVDDSVVAYNDDALFDEFHCACEA